ncbi:hypothetical protein [uncultured Tateyamaria sp.]|uniref:hypothetical protein n=1 Tax=uncultured Tateyamaria sp. TaxID=455651 RepID=UPI0026079585|nr:hypothetical protein [uncultured Tateyamaria sp.]
MMRAAVAVCALSATPAVADIAQTALEFANCVGQADAYAQAASVYGDVEVIKVATEAQFDAILPHITDPALAMAARAQGAKDWDRRADALLSNGGAMEGPAWDATVEATLACERLRADLASAGILEGAD